MVQQMLHGLQHTAVGKRGAASPPLGQTPPCGVQLHSSRKSKFPLNSTGPHREDSPELGMEKEQTMRSARCHLGVRKAGSPQSSSPLQRVSGDSSASLPSP